MKHKPMFVPKCHRKLASHIGSFPLFLTCQFYLIAIKANARVKIGPPLACAPPEYLFPAIGLSLKILQGAWPKTELNHDLKPPKWV